MSEPAALFNLPPVEPAEPLSAQRRRTARQHAALERGVHPATGLAVVMEGGNTCGGCFHASQMLVGDRKRVWKCGQHLLGRSHSEASDIRVGWPACSLWRSR